MTMPGPKRNTHETNLDVNGLIYLNIMLTDGDMIHLFITEKNFIIGKKHTDIISNITNQNECISAPNLHSSYIFDFFLFINWDCNLQARQNRHIFSENPQSFHYP